MAYAGKDVIIAVKKESTYGTAVAVTSIVPFISEDINRTINQISANYNDGFAALPQLNNTTKEAGGSLQVQCVFDEIATDIIGVDDLIFAALGSGAYDATSGYAVYKPTDELSVSYTVAIKKGSIIWELSGAKITTLEITGQAGGDITMTATFVGKKLLRTGETGITNTTSTFSGLTPANIPTLMRFDQGVFRVGALGDALASGDARCISQFTLSINNNLSPATFATTCTNHTDGTLTLEPLRNDRRSVTLSVTHPRSNDQDEFGWHLNETELQIDMKFTGSSKNFNFYLPRVRVTAPTENVSGRALVPKTVQYTALRNGTTNEDMETSKSGDTIADEIAIETKNARTAIPS